MKGAVMLNRRRPATRGALGALAPGGRIFVVDFTLESDRGPSPAHKLTPEAVIAELAAAGLSAQALEEDLPDQYVVEGRRPDPAP
jgi:hypothetical protein